MDEWILFWKCMCIIGLAVYLVTLIIIIPLGARDILRLLKSLRKPNQPPSYEP